MRTIFLIILLVFFNLSKLANAEALYPTEQENIQVFNQVAPSVVNVLTTRHVRHNFEVMEVRDGEGSGFLWDKEGHIITNFHVIYAAKGIVVSLQNGASYHADIVGAEPRKDIAILKINDPEGLNAIRKLTPVKLGDSSKLQVGQKAIAIGNPFGLDQTMTVGVVSALNRRIMGLAEVTIQNMIQTDASINPGNSGGPLLDSHGRLIGMNTLIYSSSGASAGIGFAVPVNDIKRIAEQIIKHGRVLQPGIGVQLLGENTSRYFNVKGVIIGGVAKNSPAARAKLQGVHRTVSGHLRLGDTIIGLNGKPVRNYDDLYNVLDTVKIGETITLKIIRDKQERQIELNTIDINGHT